MKGNEVTMCLCNWSLKLGSRILLLAAPGTTPFMHQCLCYPPTKAKATWWWKISASLLIWLFKFVSRDASLCNCMYIWHTTAYEPSKLKWLFDNSHLSWPSCMVHGTLCDLQGIWSVLRPFQIPSIAFKHRNSQHWLSTLRILLLQQVSPRMCARIFMRHLHWMHFSFWK